MNEIDIKFILKEMEYDYILHKYIENIYERCIFDSIEELKSYIFSNYTETSLDKLMNNKFDELYLSDNDRKLVIEIVE